MKNAADFFEFDNVHLVFGTVDYSFVGNQVVYMQKGHMATAITNLYAYGLF